MLDTRTELTMLDLCSGIGGMTLGALLGSQGAIRTVAFAEIDPFCSLILDQHFPDIPNLGDIHGITEETVYAATGLNKGQLAILAAGFPCQPYSAAGQRKGAEDERAIYPEIGRLIRDLRPRWVVLENVRGLISLAIDDIYADLADAKYEAGTYVFPAAAVGASHQRERIFLVAHPYRATNNGERGRLARTLFAGRAEEWQTDGRTIGHRGTDGERRDALAVTERGGWGWSRRSDAGDVAGATRADAAGEGDIQRPAVERGCADGGTGYPVADPAGARLPAGQPTDNGAQATESRTGVVAEPERRGGGGADKRSLVADASGAGLEGGLRRGHGVYAGEDGRQEGRDLAGCGAARSDACDASAGYADAAAPLRASGASLADASSAGSGVAQHRGGGQAWQSTDALQPAALRQGDGTAGTERTLASGDVLADADSGQRAERTQFPAGRNEVSPEWQLWRDADRCACGRDVADPDRLGCGGRHGVASGNDDHRATPGRGQGAGQTEERGGDGGDERTDPTDCAGSQVPQSRLGRLLDGVHRGMGVPRWPARRGLEQHAWEASRVIAKHEKKPYYQEQIRAIGNAIVPQQVAPVFAALVATEMALTLGYAGDEEEEGEGDAA